MRAFIALLEFNVKDIYDKFFKFPRKMNWTDVEKEKFNAATICHICGENFKDKTNFNHAHVARRLTTSETLVSVCYLKHRWMTSKKSDIIATSPVSLEVQHTDCAILGIKYQVLFLWYFTTCLVKIAIYLLRNWLAIRGRYRLHSNE